MDLKSQVLFLKGLVNEEGMGEKDEVWAEAIGLLERMADRIETIAAGQSEILEYVEALDEDLSVLESQFVQRGPEEDEDGMDFNTGEEETSLLRSPERGE